MSRFSLKMYTDKLWKDKLTVTISVIYSCICVNKQFKTYAELKAKLPSFMEKANSHFAFFSHDFYMFSMVLLLLRNITAGYFVSIVWTILWAAAQEVGWIGRSMHKWMNRKDKPYLDFVEICSCRWVQQQLRYIQLSAEENVNNHYTYDQCSGG